MYIHIIHAYRCAPVGAEPSTHACIYISTRTRTHEGMGSRQPQMEPRMRVCAPVHPYTPRGTSAHASRHMLAWDLHVHTYAHACTHTYTCTHGDTHLAAARSCCAAARAHTHAHSCTSTRPARTLECTLRAHADVYTCAHTYVDTYVPGETAP
jgi:hypothetical protein